MVVTRISRFIFTAVLAAAPAVPASAAQWYVASGGSGNGTSAAPFGRIQDAIKVAQPGDTVIVGAGTFNERLTSVRHGTSQLPIVVRAANARGSTIVTASGRVLTVGHAYHIIEGLVVDGQFGADDLIRVSTGANGFTLRNAEVRRTSRDAVDVGAVQDTLIESSLIHHALNPTNGRSDAHGVVAGAVKRFTIRNTEIHTFSGDAFQVDPGRSAPGWSDVLVEGCRFWLQPLPAAVNGFPAGTAPGENAVDTKSASTNPRATITVRDTVAYGFRQGFVTNMAAFNIKENVDATLDGITAYGSEIGFRLRAPALVRVQNAVLHSNAYGVRYENDIQNLRIWNSTFGGGNGQFFYAASSSASVLDVKNTLFLGSAVPKAAATHATNIAVAASAFVSAANHNYQLASGSPATDKGITIAAVATDRQGTTRPQGSAYDIGAYERVASTSPLPDQDNEIVLHAWKATMIAGNWQLVSDSSAASGARMASIDEGAPKIKTAVAQPMDYFELTFTAEAGRPYRLWLRGRAASNYWGNDSVFAQFNDSVDAQGRAIYRIGTTSGADINLEDCSGCKLSGWGWQDNGWGVNVLGPVIYFAKTGTHTIRIQTREDGFSIDQIVLSASAYLTKPPGFLKNDMTLLAESGNQ